MPTVSLAAYGALLSTFGIAWQIWKAWSERRWITTSYNFRGVEDPGNEILLINNSSMPITIFKTELFWGRRFLGFTWRYSAIGIDPWREGDSDTGVTLDPYKITTLYYSHDRHFNWRYDKRPAARIYLSARIVGQRRSVVLFIFRQNSWKAGWFRRQLDRLGLAYGAHQIYLDDVPRLGTGILESAPPQAEEAKLNEPDGDEMSKRQAFEELINTEFRWPTAGDIPFLEAADPMRNAVIADDGFTRLVLMTDGYKAAADLAVKHTVKNSADRDLLVFAIIFNYRQFLELSLKYQLATHGGFVGIAPNWKTHDLADLWSSFNDMLERYGTRDPDDADPIVRSVVLEFAKIDPGSYSYRYPVDRKGEPIPIEYGALDLSNLADVMKAVAGYFDGCDGFLTDLRRL